MLSSVLNFFKGELNNYLKQLGSENPVVSFPTLSNTPDAIVFDTTGINIMIINVEEESTMRQADIFREERNGRSFPALPEIRLNLYLLFVADLKLYETSVNLLSLVIRFFQGRRVFTPENSPGLADFPDIEKLTAELITLPFAQQNEVWNALRTSYKPYLLYKIRMVVFRPEDPVVEGPQVIEIQRQLIN